MEIKAKNSITERLVYIDGVTENIVPALQGLVKKNWSEVVKSDNRFDTVNLKNWLIGNGKISIKEITEKRALCEVFWTKEDGTIRTHLLAEVSPTEMSFDRPVKKSAFRTTTEIALLETLLETAAINNPTVVECERHPERDAALASTAHRSDKQGAKNISSVRFRSKKRYHGRVTDRPPYNKKTWCKPGYFRMTGYAPEGDENEYSFDARKILKEFSKR